LPNRKKGVKTSAKLKGLKKSKGDELSFEGIETMAVGGDEGGRITKGVMSTD
jgi:hypothetical protein